MWGHSQEENPRTPQDYPPTCSPGQVLMSLISILIALQLLLNSPNPGRPWPRTSGPSLRDSSSTDISSGAPWTAISPVYQGSCAPNSNWLHPTSSCSASGERYALCLRGPSSSSPSHRHLFSGCLVRHRGNFRIYRRSFRITFAVWQWPRNKAWNFSGN